MHLDVVRSGKYTVAEWVRLWFDRQCDQPGDVSKQKVKMGRSDQVMVMWMLFALLSAVFAAFTSILAKTGIEGVNSNLTPFARW